MTSSAPLVSVVVPAYRHEPYVGEALQSIFEQDYPRLELVVLDDRSPDRTAEVASAYLARPEVRQRFERIVFLENERNLGAHQTINRGLQATTGDYINILNSDDRFAPTRLSRLMSACQEASTEFAFSRVELLYQEAPSTEEFGYFYDIQDGIERFPTVGYALLCNQCAISSGNFFFSRKVYEQVGDLAPLKYCHDWDFILRSILVTEPVFVREPLYSYRMHSGNSFLALQACAEAETETVLRNYLFLCRTRPATNPLAPSPAWGAFFESFIENAGYAAFRAKP